MEDYHLYRGPIVIFVGKPYGHSKIGFTQDAGAFQSILLYKLAAVGTVLTEFKELNK